MTCWKIQKQLCSDPTNPIILRSGWRQMTYESYSTLPRTPNVAPSSGESFSLPNQYL